MKKFLILPKRALDALRDLGSMLALLWAVLWWPKDEEDDDVDPYNE